MNHWSIMELISFVNLKIWYRWKLMKNLISTLEIPLWLSQLRSPMTYSSLLLLEYFRCRKFFEGVSHNIILNTMYITESEVTLLSTHRSLEEAPRLWNNFHSTLSGILIFSRGEKGHDSSLNISENILSQICVWASRHHFFRLMKRVPRDMHDIRQKNVFFCKWLHLLKIKMKLNVC